MLEEDFLVAAGGALHDALQSGEAQFYSTGHLEVIRIVIKLP